MTLNKILDINREKILRIAASYGARDLRVFGSVSRGEANLKSDIDILITLETGRSLLDIVALKQDLEDLLGCKLDVVTEEAVSPYIREEILSNAISL
jgi:predicted nucleotidyltransferase